MIADAMDVLIGQQQVAGLRDEISALPTWTGARASVPATSPVETHGITLATWNQLLDSGSLQDGEPFLAATGRPTVAYMSQHSAEAIGVTTGDAVNVFTAAGAVQVPAVITLMADSTVWLPTNNEGSHVRASLHAAHGTQVHITRGGVA